MPDTCVVHLVRAKNGVEPLERFMESYRQYGAGVKHDLVILYKGFAVNADLSQHRRLVADRPHHELRVSDYGFDLGAYFKAARTLEHKYICFLNSYSRIAQAGWLELFRSAITQPHVGVVGASGSWASHLSMDLSPDHWFLENSPWYERALRRQPFRNVMRWRARCYFDPFPNVHLRTNGFLLHRSTFVSLHEPWFLRKAHALRFESGKSGFTRQIERSGLKPVIVGRDGLTYCAADWARSNTFWQSRQENLLIWDNRADDYMLLDDRYRQFICDFAWGHEARPFLRSSCHDVPPRQ